MKMKNNVLPFISLFLFLLLFLLWNPEKALACTLKLIPSSVDAVAGETVTFRLERYITHRQCVLPLEETKISITGGKLVDPGIWKKGTPDVLEFKVIFEQPGRAAVRVERNCPKGGLIVVEAQGAVKAAPGGAASPTVTVQGNPAAADPTVDSGSGPDTGAESLPSASAGWISDPTHLIIWFIFLAVGFAACLLKLTLYRKTLLFLSLIVLGFYLGGCPEPVGAPFYLLSRNKALFGTALLLLVLPVAISFVWGRVFCGWVCPIGAVQEFIYAGRFRSESPFAVSAPVDMALKKLKFAVLAVFGYLSWQTSHNAFSDVDPFKALFNFDGTPLTVALLVLVLLASVVLSRPFCRYFCPLGALFTLTSVVAPLSMRLNQEACIRCGLCTRQGTCPMNAVGGCNDASSWPRIDNKECIMCRNCETVCRRSAITAQRRYGSAPGKAGSDLTVSRWGTGI